MARRNGRPGDVSAIVRYNRTDVDTLLSDRKLIDRFNKRYYDTANPIHWLGIPCMKTPTDLWEYQHILCETRPDYVIETGTACGGTALFLADVCDHLGLGGVITIDNGLPKNGAQVPHPLLTYIKGDSATFGTLRIVERHVGNAACMVILDSDHSCDHVLKELDLYAPLVGSGCYLVVEDTNLNGHPVRPEDGPGPMEALEEWLPDHPEFEVDRARERYMLTFNPKGYLKRK